MWSKPVSRYLEEPVQSVQKMDYDLLRTRFRHVFLPRRRCVIVANLDSLLSFLLLRRALDWNLAGVYAPPWLYLSPDESHPALMALDDAQTIQTSMPVFVGINVCRLNVHSLGRDILKWTAESPTPFDQRPGAALNPNLLRGIDRRSLDKRFPFGLSCFVFCCMAYWFGLDRYQWPPTLAAIFLYANRGYDNLLKRPASALRWSKWLAPDDRLGPVFPLAQGYRALDPKTMISTSVKFSERLESFGMSRRADSIPIDNSSGLSRLRDLAAWLQEITGLEGHLDTFFKRPRRLLMIERLYSTGSRRGYSEMMGSMPFTYSILGSGGRGIRHDHIRPTAAIE